MCQSRVDVNTVAAMYDMKLASKAVVVEMVGTVLVVVDVGMGGFALVVGVVPDNVALIDIM